MKFTTLLTKASAMAFILAAGITHSMAAEVDCTAAYAGDEDTKPPANAMKCVNAEATILTNKVFAEAFRETHCVKKTFSTNKADWKHKNAMVTQAVCEKIGTVLDCDTAWAECAGDKDCEKLAVKKQCREPKALKVIKAAAATPPA